MRLFILTILCIGFLIPIGTLTAGSPSDVDLVGHQTILELKTWLLSQSLEHDSIRQDADEDALTYLTNRQIENVLKKTEFKEYRLRRNIVVDTSAIGSNLQLSILILSCACKVYWDGRLIGANGTPAATADQERPGRIRFRVTLPNPQPGLHRIEISVSSHCQTPRIHKIEIGPKTAFDKRDRVTHNANLIITTFLVTMCLVNLILFIGFNRNPAYVFLFLYSAFHTIKILFLTTWLFVSSEFGTTMINQVMMDFGFIAASVSLTAFLLHKFRFEKRNWIILILALFSIPWISTQHSMVHFYIFQIIAYSITIYALVKRKQSALLILVGLLGMSIGSLLWEHGIVSLGYFLGMVFFILCMTVVLGYDLVKQNQSHQKAMLRSARLQNQLLKKNIQPHFIMNALTSLQELIDTQPDKASYFIDALAEEFRMFSKSSGRTLIPLHDELEICLAHLKIMGYRKNAGFTLTTQGLTGDETIPPGVLHTVIENGLTHGYPGNSGGKFHLVKETVEGGIRYTLTNDGSSAGSAEKPGTGLSYIASRLDESYPGGWELTSQPVLNGWETVITLYDENGNRSNANRHRRR